MMDTVNLSHIQYDGQGLIPAVVQEKSSGKVLMVAYMNEESLRKTIETEETWFYSRSRQCLWHKGETSGHVQRVAAIAVDCDADTLLLQVDQTGAACHTGNISCFFRRLQEFAAKPYTGSVAILSDLQKEIREKKIHPTEKSYTAYLFSAGIDKICKKIGEEAAEVIIAAKNADHVVTDISENGDHLREEVCKESADLLYHLSVLWENAGVTVNDVMAVLEARSHIEGNKKEIGHQDKTF